MASTITVTAQISNLQWNKAFSLPISPCNLNLSANFAGKEVLSWFHQQKCGRNFRSLRVNGLFGGGKKDNEKSDDAPSKAWTSSRTRETFALGHELLDDNGNLNNVLVAKAYCPLEEQLIAGELQESQRR